MQTKRIAFLHPFLIHYHEPRLRALAQECQSSGISLCNVTIASHTDIYKSMTISGGQLFRDVTLFPGRSLEDVPTSKIWALLVKCLDDLSPDVIFLYGYSYSIFRRTRAWAEKRGIATVLISDTNIFDRKRFFLFERLKRFQVRRFDAAFVGGETSSDYLVSLGFPKERIRPGYDVVDNRYFGERSQAAKEDLPAIKRRLGLPLHYFLFVGRLVKEKNLLSLLDAYDQYERSLASDALPWDLVICGEGPEEHRLRQHLYHKGLALRTHVHFHGLIKQQDLTDYYSCASCLVLPSISESWGLVINEAMACGLPVLASRHCGCARDLVKPGLNGWVFDPFHPEEIAQLMSQAHAIDPVRLSAMGSCSQEIISAWGLDAFSRNALRCADIALACCKTRQVN